LVGGEEGARYRRPPGEEIAMYSEYNGIRVTAVDAGGGKGFLHAMSKDKTALDEVAVLTAKIPEITKVAVEWVEPFTYTRANGTLRTIGGYWKMIADF
jgi:hypothetical protein